MDARGEISTLDKQIELLMARDKLPEEEINALCDKARRRRVRGTHTTPFPLPLPAEAAVAPPDAPAAVQPRCPTRRHRRAARLRLRRARQYFMPAHPPPPCACACVQAKDILSSESNVQEVRCPVTVRRARAAHSDAGEEGRRG
jgi:hypothetical protein